MNPKLSLSLIAVAMALTAAPAMAETTSAPGRPIHCDSTVTMDAIERLSVELMLSTKRGASIDTFGGCIQVRYYDDKGSMIEFYDPDTLNLIGKIHVG
jgi:hypothetical protein